jgi:hypothetical protein
MTTHPRHLKSWWDWQFTGRQFHCAQVYHNNSTGTKSLLRIQPYFVVSVPLVLALGHCLGSIRTSLPTQ